MAGHVPKFGDPNGGNFTETFDIARCAGKGGSGESRGSKPAETNNPPPTRRIPQRGRPAAATATAAGRKAVRPNPKPVPVSDGGKYGDSHIPTFGTWNNNDGAQIEYTGIFTAASNAKKGGGPALESASGGKGFGGGGSGDLYKPSSKKRSPSWWCFGA